MDCMCLCIEGSRGLMFDWPALSLAFFVGMESVREGQGD